MNQEVLERNRLIAEFMGFYLYSDSPYYYSKDENGEIEHRGMYFDALKYHTSWDWLMPVVQKIKATDTGTLDVYSLYVEDSLRTANISDVYNAVIDFIKNYNQTKDGKQVD